MKVTDALGYHNNVGFRSIAFCLGAGRKRPI
jgi:hypothetical protein